MNLENLYGSHEQLVKVFESALQQNEPIEVFTKLVAIYEQSNKMDVSVIQWLAGWWRACMELGMVTTTIGSLQSYAMLWSVVHARVTLHWQAINLCDTVILW